MAEKEIVKKLRDRVKKPISNPKHEAKETPAEEKCEHRTGKEVQD